MKLLFENWRKFLNEEEAQPGKVIFMAGAPGSGKSTVIEKLGLENMEIINPDEFYEPALEKAGLGKNVAQIRGDFKEARQELKDLLGDKLKLEEPESGWSHDELVDMYQTALGHIGNDRFAANELTRAQEKYDATREKCSLQAQCFVQAKRSAKEKQAVVSEEGKSFIIDGTGGQYGMIVNQKNDLENQGYETAMIFVDIPLQVAIDRQADRLAAGGRSLGAGDVARSWEVLHGSEEDPEKRPGLMNPFVDRYGREQAGYIQEFDPNFFHIIATNEEMDDSIAEAQPEISRFMTGQQLNEADWQKWVRANYNKQVGAYTRGGKNKTKPTGWEEAPIDYRGSAPPGASGG